MSDAAEPYAVALGRRLRAVRSEQELSLQEVEVRSEGEWKAGVVGSYERGDRNISVAGLCRLADLYGVPVAELLPEDDAPRPAARAGAIAIDLPALRERDDEPFASLLRYCEAIRVQRGDYAREQLTVRGDDLRAMAVIADTGPDELLARLREAGALRGR